MHPAIAAKGKELATLCREFGVRRLEVFGSAARGDDFRPGSSDADFLVEFGDAPHLDALGAFFGLRTALSDLLQYPVDLVESGAIRNPYLRRAIDADRQLIYAA